jgi:sulfonate transport system permease protein
MDSYHGLIRLIKESFSKTAVVLMLFLAWWLASAFTLVQADILPPPAKILRTSIELATTGNLGFHLKMSLSRVIRGFLFGGSIGFVLGILMGLSRTVEKLIGPLFHGVRQVPLLGWMPLIILWCGIGETSKVVFISIGALYPMALNTFEGVRSISREYLEVARVFEFKRFRLIRTIILPAALPSILTGIRFSLTIAWMLVVGAEIFSVSAGGLGDMIWSARDTFRMDIVIVGLIIITLIGIILNKSVELLGTHFQQWRRTSHS